MVRVSPTDKIYATAQDLAECNQRVADLAERWETNMQIMQRSVDELRLQFEALKDVVSEALKKNKSVVNRTVLGGQAVEITVRVIRD